MSNQTERVDHLAAALRYASQGVPVFPLAPRSKFPLISAANGGHGLHDATTDAARIQAWWMAHPTANIGLKTGVVFDVIDLDSEAAVDALESAAAGRDLTECERTVDSGLSAAMERPRGMAIG
jgi:hypothetical protein